MTQRYNAAADLLGRNLDAGRGEKIAFIDDVGSYTFAELARRAERFASAIRAIGVEPEQRVLLCVTDGIDFPVAFLGCILVGVVPVAVNTLLTTADYGYMLGDSRARALVVSAELLATFAAVPREAIPRHVIVSGVTTKALPADAVAFDAFVASGSVAPDIAATTSDDACFWLYSSGSTGKPKGTVHVHSSLVQTAELYAGPILGLRADDVNFSAAKLFFAYGLGNALTFPLWSGGTSVLMAQRATPAAVFERLRLHLVTAFYGVPTLYAAMLASPDAPPRSALSLRRCASAGETLPADIGRRWSNAFGVDILDGIGSTEMLHIFLSNRTSDVRYGTTGMPVPGYALRIVGDDGAPVPRGTTGDLHVSGPTSAVGYWNQRERSRTTFVGSWTCTGDKFHVDDDGYYVYDGRSDDMLKVGGIYVSPAEVEGALVEHEAVLECAVVGREDDEHLVKPSAYVVLRDGYEPSDAVREILKAHVKSRLAPYKYPRWFEFVDQLPKTATGKIQRFKLRAQAASDVPIAEPVGAAL